MPRYMSPTAINQIRALPPQDKFAKADATKVWKPPAKAPRNIANPI